MLTAGRKEARLCDKTLVYLVIICACCIGGCGRSDKSRSSYDFPPVLPIWIVELDPNKTVFDRKDLQADRKVGKIIVVPLYKDFQNGNGNDSLAIAHPFLCQPGEELEPQLSSFGQRDRLRRLIVWAHGYFPGSIDRTFDWIPFISGKRMIVRELPPCTPSEKDQVDRAMKELLLNGDFVVEPRLTWTTRPKYSTSATRTDDNYDFRRLVRSEIYESRYSKYGGYHEFLLWAFDSGTRIANRLTSDDKTMITEFVAAGMDKPVE